MVDFDREQPRYYIDPSTGLFRDRWADQVRYDRWLRKVGEWTILVLIFGWLAAAIFLVS
jgi:hypothetical protein